MAEQQAVSEGPEYAVIETNRGGGVEYPVAERNTNGPAGWMIGGEFVPESAVTHVAPVTVTRCADAPDDDAAPRDPVVGAANLLFEVRHYLPPDVLRTLADVWTCASAARYGAPHERFWEADDQWDPFADHDTADCERPEDLMGAHLESGARRPHDVPTATDGPSVVVDRMMRRLSGPDLPAVGQHADLVRSLRGHAGPAVACTDGHGEDPKRAAGAVAALDMVNARIRAAERPGEHQAPADEPKPWHGGPAYANPETVSEGWDEEAGQPVVDNVGWDLTFGARVTIGRARERDEETGTPLPATWRFHLSLFDRDGAAPCTASLTKDVTPEQVRSYGEQLIALAGGPASDTAPGGVGAKLPDGGEHCG